MKKWTTDNIPDQSGKIIVITGANSGLGFESSLALAEKGARIVMACRNLDKGVEAKQKILEVYPRALIDLQPLDLASLRSVHDFSEYMHKSYDKIHILLNNAGVMATPYAVTDDGFELQLGINHLGHFALTSLLLDVILQTEDSRIVNVSSIAAQRGRINFDDLMSKRSYVPWKAYGQTKLANQLFTYELQRRLEARALDTISLAAHPGVSMTNLHEATDINGSLKTAGVFLFGWIFQKASKGALPQLFAATDPTARPGGYYGPGGFREMSGYPAEAQIPPQAKDRVTASRLWEVSEQLTGIAYDL